jgi:proline dehydrogenase
MVKDEAMPNQSKVVDFSNTEVAFSNKTDEELRQMAWLFGLMNKKWLVDIGSPLTLFALKLHLPFVNTIIKKTIYKQFVGGTTLLECQPAIDKLYKEGVSSILDYGVEAKTSEQEYNKTMNENLRAVEFAATNTSVPIVSTKITGLGRFGLFESIQNGDSLTKETRTEYRNVLKRMDAISSLGSKYDVKIFFDAEETWIQDTLDHLVTVMMRRYNRGKVVVYNTYQMYRKDSLSLLMEAFEKAQKANYMLGAKLVRGAYMDKERERAEEMGYPSPIHPTKAATDDCYNMGLRFCVDNYEKIGLSNATHNAESSLLLAELIQQKDLPREHPHFNFCQLYGMSDHLTFNLADQGYNVAKYLPYGQIKDVIPYLVRRAQENASVTGDMSREYELVMKEMKRRNL